MLLEQQVDGVWIYPASNQKTIFNLSHAMQVVTEFRMSLVSPEMLADFARRISAIEERGNGVPTSINIEEKTHSQPVIRRIIAAVIAVASFSLIIWLIVGEDAFEQLLARILVLRDHPIMLILSLSGIILAAGIGRWIPAKALFALWGLLIVMAFLISIHGGALKALAAVSPPLVAAIVTYLVNQYRRGRETSR